MHRYGLTSWDKIANRKVKFSDGEYIQTFISGEDG